MSKNFVTIIALCLFISVAGTGSAYADSKQAIDQASKTGQFLMLIFYKDKDAGLDTMEKAVNAFKPKSEKPFMVFKANVKDAAEKEIVAKYVANAPLPLLLVFAPNGVITAGFPKTITGDQLKQSVGISELILRILKPLQDQKIVLVSIQNFTTRFNNDSSKAVNDFASDPQYKDWVGVVKADPISIDSKEFLMQCGLGKPLTDATIVVLLPPGKIGKIITGKTKKEDILAALQACSGGSCSGGTCSDRRFKENITPIDSALKKVSRLTGVSFTWNNIAFPGRNFPKDREIGLIAQDVEPVIPEVVHTDFEGYKSISYDKLVAVLIEAVKELKTDVDERDVLIQELRSRIEKLEANK